ncbi:MAG TPA: tRNA lysidine(34) synthetase [Solirubrobacteraceae bacterium]|jgi:tRNA(Ile)-lysidine synthase|nr:tRNA lysidine(34) synthetase [Solirubrobacteraceae bacterium]
MTPDEVLDRVRAGGLLPSGERGGHRVIAMLSGGRDSVCLLDLAAIVCGAERVHALHVNYGLRAEADEEERHCRALCERLGVELEVVRAERPAGPGNLQAWAREVRYGEALRLARELDAQPVDGRQEGERPVDGRQGEKRPEGERPGSGDARGETPIATGHTATDQVETILYRLAASPGRRALLGMSPRDGRLVRPLLELTREQTAAYCRARGLPWREDPSNDDERYARARVRNRLLPALDAVHPAARENVLRTARLLREEGVVLDALVDAELERDLAALAETGADWGDTRSASAAGLHGRGGEPSVAIERLRDLPPVLARLLVVRLAEEAAGAYVPQAGARVGEILDLAARGGRAELHVGGLVAAVIEGGRLRMVRLPPRS